ncbi:MAG: 1-(5-phosphoribosyl)-5-[(5-phosphoribosylamino) methylideneamino]imidazole-4-carboxamide isomerase [Promethearchaeota archaeon]
MGAVDFEVIPAVDLRGGRCVRLVQGKAGTEKIYYENPVDAAKEWVRQGADRLHVVDLDAALGVGDNSDVIATIVNEVDVRVQVGGGVRSPERGVELVDAGVDRVIVGTMAIRSPAALRELVERVGSSHVVVALDHVDGKVAVKGWTETTSIDATTAALKARDNGAGRVLVTSVRGDGTFLGPDLATTRAVVDALDLPVIAAGGIRNAEDVEALIDLGVGGVVLGKSLYEGRIDLRKLVERVKRIIIK